MQRLLPVRPLRMRTDISAFRWKISRDQWKPVIQTRKVGKERNKDASILIDRHFSPATRAYGYRELHPEWSNIAHWQQEVPEKFDSLYMDSIRRVDGLYLLDEVEIKSKRRSQSTNMATKINEQSIDAYYDIRQAVDQLRDNGKVVTTIPEVMEKIKSTLLLGPFQ